LGDGTIGGEDLLDMPRGFEPLYASLPLARWELRILRAVVERSMLPVFHAWKDLALSASVALRFGGGSCTASWPACMHSTPLPHSMDTQQVDNAFSFTRLSLLSSLHSQPHRQSIALRFLLEEETGSCSHIAPGGSLEVALRRTPFDNVSADGEKYCRGTKNWRRVRRAKEER